VRVCVCVCEFDFILFADANRSGIVRQCDSSVLECLCVSVCLHMSHGQYMSLYERVKEKMESRKRK